MRVQRIKTSLTFLAYIAMMFTLSMADATQKVIKDKRGRTIYADVDPKSGGVKEIYHLNEHIKDYNLSTSELNHQTVDRMGRALIDNYSSLLEINSKDLKEKNIEKAGGFWRAVYFQTVHGIPIEGSNIGFVIGEQGDVISFGSQS